MSGVILQINYRFKVSKEAHDQAVAQMANDIAATPGLQWKIWLMDEKNSEAGGIYYFDSPAAAKAFLDSALATQIVQHTALSDFSVKKFDIAEKLSHISRAPLGVRSPSG